MYTAEQIFESLTYEELYWTLKSIVDEDCWVDDVINNETTEDFFYILDVYDLIFLSSDNRILLTPKGEKILQIISNKVELEKKHTKLKNKSYKL